MNRSQNNRLRPRLGALIGTLAAMSVLLAAPAGAAAAPELDVASSHVLDKVAAGTYAQYEIAVSNVSGSDPVSGAITMDFALPPGLRVVSADDEINQAYGFPMWDCAIAGDSLSVSCDGIDTLGLFGGPLPIGSGQEACADTVGATCRILLGIKADPGAVPGLADPTITVCGGGDTVCPAVAATVSDPIEVTGPPTFEILGFDGGAFDELGDPETLAGIHPYTASTTFDISTTLTSDGVEISTDDLKDVVTKLPPGVVGNPQGVPFCTQELISAFVAGGTNCPAEAQVGTVNVGFNGLFGGTPGRPVSNIYPLYNMQRGPGTPALLAFNAIGSIIQVYARVRNGEDYGADVIVKNSPQSITVAGVDTEVWGVPADPSHDSSRFCAGRSGPPCTIIPTPPLKPFFTLPTSCVGPVETFVEATGWLGGESGSSFLSHDNAIPPAPIGTEGCNALTYPDAGPNAPTIEARPTTNVGDAPSGLDVDLRIPQNEDPNGPGRRPPQGHGRSPCPRAWWSTPAAPTVSTAARWRSSATPPPTPMGRSIPRRNRDPVPRRPRWPQWR